MSIPTATLKALVPCIPIDLTLVANGHAWLIVVEMPLVAFSTRQARRVKPSVLAFWRRDDGGPTSVEVLSAIPADVGPSGVDVVPVRPSPTGTRPVASLMRATIDQKHRRSVCTTRKALTCLKPSLDNDGPFRPTVTVMALPQRRLDGEISCVITTDTAPCVAPASSLRRANRAGQASARAYGGHNKLTLPAGPTSAVDRPLTTRADTDRVASNPTAASAGGRRVLVAVVVPPDSYRFKLWQADWWRVRC